MRSEIHLILKKGRYIPVKSPIKNSFTYYADWKTPYYGTWKPLERIKNPFEREILVWKHFLTDTNLVDYSNQGEYLSPDSYAKILSFIPAIVPSYLAAKFLDTLYLSALEVTQIERECYMLWQGEGGMVKDPHPLLDEIITAMGFYEKLGIKFWPDLNQLPVRTYYAIRHVLSNYATIMNQNELQRRSRQRAIQESGVGKYVNSRPRVV